ncbi:MAG: hypothetical protein JXA20_16725 [Spirochaetes bacterium]|nr:hypothetical protein [Spirochaetota bacterium]
MRGARIKYCGAISSMMALMVFILPPLSSRLRAEEVSELGFLRPRAVLTADYVPTSGFDGHKLSFRSFSLSSTIPLGGPYVNNEGSLAFFQAFLSCSLGLAQPDISVMKGISNVETGTMVFSTLFITSSRKLFALSAGVSISEEINSFSSLQPTPYCLGIGTWRPAICLHW